MHNIGKRVHPLIRTPSEDCRKEEMATVERKTWEV